MAIRFGMEVPRKRKDTICHIPSVHCHAPAPSLAYWFDEIMVSQKGRLA
jgi:hypothetical protein